MHIFGFYIGHETELTVEILLMSDRIKQAERRIHCRMVHPLIIAEIGAAEIDRSYGKTSADRNEETCGDCQHQQ